MSDELKKWSELNVEEKIKAMPEYKKSVMEKIKELKKKLANEKIKLKNLEQEEKSLKYDLIAQKAKERNQNIEDLM